MSQARNHMKLKKKVIMPNIAKSLEIVPSKWPLLGHVLEDCSISKPTNAQPSPHQGYRGLDLKLQYNLENLMWCFVTPTHTDHLKSLSWSIQYDSAFCSPTSDLLFPRRDFPLL